jgi:hypothetical protein
MAAQLVDKLPGGPEWLYELQLDCYRALLIKPALGEPLVPRCVPAALVLEDHAGCPGCASVHSGGVMDNLHSASRLRSGFLTRNVLVVARNVPTTCCIRLA